MLLGLVACASPASAQEVTVERVVDGDTVDVRTDEGVERVRLLNIDTPETKDPNRDQECLGPEATVYTESILRPGDVVVLEFDRDRSDSYGRTLAHVKLGDGRYASDLIAAQGLGEALVIGENDKRFEEVRDAMLSASEKGRGFFDASIECTLAAQIAGAAVQATTISEVETGVTAAEAAAALAALAVVKETLATMGSIAHDADWIGRRVFVSVGRAGEIAAISGARESLTRAMSDVEAESTKRKAAEAEAAKAKKEAEEKRVAEANRVAEAKRVAEADARQKAAAQARRSAAERANSGNNGSSGSSDPYPGYTGPRCYAPGGKTWKPC